MMTAYFRGSSIRIPPIFTNSAVTPSTFMELIFSTTAGGNAFSIPKTIPIFLVLTGHSSPRVAHLKIPRFSLVILSEAKDPVLLASLITASRRSHVARTTPIGLRPTANAKQPLKIFPRHLQPQRPVMLRIIPPNIQPIWNRLGIQHRRQFHVLVQAHIPVGRSQHNLHLPVAA